MPYTTKWVAPQIFMRHQGVKVYHVYRDNELDQGRRRYDFTLLVDGCEDSGDTFDVRQLKAFIASQITYVAPYSPEETALIKRAIRRALDTNELRVDMAPK